ncbi:MAG: hypothetical protein IJV80_01035 [Clostridia bacterium]|nr:hypothetical protein [Clostridia bacterium]
MDSFEGGKGARASFLKRVAAKYKAETGVIITVSSLTRIGAQEAFAKGNYPDLFSFGNGVSSALERAVSLRGVEEKALIGGEKRAVAWCKGGYAVYSKKDDFSQISAENTVLSQGGNNLPSVAMAVGGFQGEYTEFPSTTAYVKFLNGEYAYLVGTQRDLYRFSSRGVPVFMKPLTKFCDLYQYLSVTAEGDERIKPAMEFAAFLLSDNVQKTLVEVGMSSAVCSVYGGGEMQAEMDKEPPKYTLPAFIGAEGLRGVKQAALSVLRGESDVGLKKFLKSV